MDRLDARTADRLWQTATDSGLMVENASARQRLTAIRSTYGPYLEALSEYLLMDLPPWVPAPNAQDNWETTTWDFASPVTLLGPNTPFSKS